MSDISAEGKPSMMVMEAKVIRADGTVEDLGEIAYWHKNPVRRLIWRLKNYKNKR